MGYTLIIGRVDKDRFAEKEEDRDKAVYQGRCDHINELNIPSIEVAHQIAKLCNVTTYCIAEGGDSWDKELVFCTQDILDYDKKVEQERVERSKTQSALADHQQPAEGVLAQPVRLQCVSGGIPQVGGGVQPQADR